jgi:hypothetical protein
MKKAIVPTAPNSKGRSRFPSFKGTFSSSFYYIYIFFQKALFYILEALDAWRIYSRHYFLDKKKKKK